MRGEHKKRSGFRIVLSTFFILLLVVGAFFLVKRYAGIDRIRPQAPTAPPEYTLKPERSETTINLPVAIPLTDLQRALTEKVPGAFSGEGRDFTDRLNNDGWDYEMHRGDIELGASEQEITFSIPIAGTARAWGESKRGKTVRGQIDIEGTISGGITIKIDDQWNVKPDLSLSVDLSKAEIPVGRIGKISVRKQLTKQLNKQIDKQKPNIIAAIVERLNLKTTAEKAWERLYFVKQMKDGPVVWLRSEPQGVIFKPFDLTDDINIRTGLGMKVLLDTFVSEDAPTVHHKPLPDLVLQNNIPERFSIYVPIQVSFDELNKTLKSKISGQSFDVAGGVSMKVNEISLATLGKRILVSIAFKANKGSFAERVRGKLYLLGRIHYDKVSSNLSVVELDYDLNTKQTVLSAADWLLKPMLLEEIEKRLSFPVSEKLASAKNEANRIIGELKMPPEFDADIEIQSIELDRVALTHNAFHFVLLVNGDISATFRLADKKQQALVAEKRVNLS